MRSQTSFRCSQRSDCTPESSFLGFRNASRSRDTDSWPYEFPSESRSAFKWKPRNIHTPR
ncbi:MAG: hypothetical protein BJ554DRAFT_878 [Olpidium bornovanus]|uniref:Uncharacterized protein n=1 Tax=Olpidium bornovanus TaxID=278681 RepID=A0A8H8DHR7_9FUNG|nr:MAG: hypothetical protein BJ554DRAFT_878 [Olpidium bornovanus]